MSINLVSSSASSSCYSTSSLSREWTRDLESFKRNFGDISIRCVFNQLDMETILDLESFIDDQFDCIEPYTPFPQILFFIAVILKHPGAVSALIDSDEVNKEWLLALGGVTVLQYACKNGDLNVVSALLEGGVDVEHSDGNGMTPLMLAVNEGHVDIVNMLLSDRFGHPAQIAPMNRWGQTALDIARSKGNIVIESLLLMIADDHDEVVSPVESELDAHTPSMEEQENIHLENVEAQNEPMSDLDFIDPQKDPIPS